MYGALSPRTFISSAAYAVPASTGDASTTAIACRLATVIPGIVTSLHDLPWSRVTWITPLLTPTQTTPGATGDAESDPMGRIGGGGGSRFVARAGVSTGFPGGGTLRSGLSLLQVTPASVVAMRY